MRQGAPGWGFRIQAYLISATSFLDPTVPQYTQSSPFLVDVPLGSWHEIAIIAIGYCFFAQLIDIKGHRISKNRPDTTCMC